MLDVEVAMAFRVGPGGELIESGEPDFDSARKTGTVRFGQRVEEYLNAQGVLAQTVDRYTCLVSSAVMRMSSRERRLVLLHELAHMEQLARPGDDPVRPLEEEAWEAAHSWMAGRRHRIRGRARGRLNALAVIQGGKKMHPFAPPWYQTSPAEPLGNGTSISVGDMTIQEDMTLESILDAVIGSKKATEILLVAHGDGSGLAIPLVAGGRGGAETRLLLPLLADHQEEEEESIGGAKIMSPIITDKAVADLTMLTEQQVKALRAKMNQVKSMKLKHVAFRACSMGIKKDPTMKAFRRFFGAESVSAPTEFDTYGNFSPSIGPDVEGWARSKRKDGFHISIDGDVAFGTRFTDSPIKYDIVARAESKDVFGAWVKKHVADGAWGHSGGVTYHGMKALHPAGPKSPSVYFIRDDAFVSRLVFVGG